MDFFQAQDAARGRTRLLVLLFLAAVVAIIVAVYVIVHLAIQAGPFNPMLFLAVAAGTILLIATGSTIRTIQLRQGGSRVAELLGGRRVPSNTTDEAERRLLNVVEEMAIASGTPVPAIFILEESGINAFAAGFALEDAAVAATRGAVEQLSRDELQGVIAHEFSHILNADMRLNIRLMGLLYGILLLAVIGRGILRGGIHSRGSRRRGKGGGGQIALVGLGLIAVGYIGVFFGKLIQAAVSRQREYLADAAAVQFTRNPGGIAGALKKVGSAGSRIENHHAQEASHFFFANGVAANFMTMLATHPPLGDRIKRIDPNFDESTVIESTPTQSLSFSFSSEPSAGRASELDIAGATLLASIGAPKAGHVAYAQQLLTSLPLNVRIAAHHSAGAAALLYALLLDESNEHAELQRVALRAQGGDALVSQTAALARELAALDASVRLPVLQVLMPALSEAGPTQLELVRATAKRMIEADDRTDVFESTLLNLLDRQRHAGEPKHNAAAASATTVHSFEAIRAPSEIVLSAIAWAGADSADAARAGFAAGADALPRLSGITLRERAELSTESLSSALDKLRPAAPAIRRTLLEACTHAVAHDGRVYALEAELLRSVAEAIDVPMPPVTATTRASAAGAGKVASHRT